MIRRMKSHRRSEPTDAEVRAILIAAMAGVAADPAPIYAFQRTGCVRLRRERTSLIQAGPGSVERSGG